MPSTTLHSFAPAHALALLEQLATPVAMLDGDAFIYVNSAFCELFEIGASRLRDLPLSSFIPATEVLLPLIQRVQKDGGPIVLRDQRLVTFSHRIVSADLVASAPVAATESNRQVTLEIHELSPDVLKTPAPRLSESLRGLAHEVKNPLAGLRGAAQLLKRKLADAELARLADMIIAEADRLSALTDRLLRGSGKPHLSTVNLHEVAERARGLIRAEAEPAMRLDRDYDPSLPHLRGDADRLLQLVLNLMRNALQAGATRVCMRSRAEHNVLINERAVRLAIRLDVIDDGEGVSEALRDSLFQPLVSGRVNGSGLGLALVQEIAREHGGAVSHHAKPGLTTFSLLLPLGVEHG